MSNTENESLVGTTTLDVGKLVSVTNRAQAIALALSIDPLVPEKAKEEYRKANQQLIKAMRAATGF